MFRPKLWPGGQEFRANRFAKHGEGVPQDALEGWFRGVHADVGGGYPEAESGLAKVSLLWMIRELQALVLRAYEPTVRKLVLGESEGHPGPDGGAPVHDSMGWGWKIVEAETVYQPPDYRAPGLGWLPFQPSLCRARIVPDGSAIHDSVVKNAEARGIPLPPNVPGDHRVVETRPVE